MTTHILISDRQTANLGDGALLARLAREVELGIAAGGNTILVGGHTLPQAYGIGEDPADMLWALRHPRGQKVTHHTDGTTRVVLTVGVEVDIYPAERTGATR